jgi:carboxylesterase type B
MFQRAIIQSGPPFQFPDVALANTTAAQTLAHLELDSEHGPASSCARSARPTFMYLFTFTTPRLAKYGAYHGMQIPFVFGTLPVVAHVAQDPDAAALCERTLRAWVAFARDGRPDAEGAPD